MSYMQSIGLEKEELFQALGVFFTVATLGLAFNLTKAGLLTGATALPGAIALVCSFAGMFTGQALRTRMVPATFGRWFMISIVELGIYLSGTAIYNTNLPRRSQ